MLKNIIYFDLATGTVKINTHAQFDEGMNDIPTLPPNAEYLNRVQKDTIPVEHTSIPSVDLNSTTNPFSVLANETIPITCDHPTFGLELFTCIHCRRVAISALLHGISAAGIRNGAHQYTSAFLVTVNGTPIFSLEDANNAVQRIRDDMDITDISVTLSPEQQLSLRDMSEPFVFCIDQLRAIDSIRNDTHDALDTLTDDDLTLLVATLLNPKDHTPGAQSHVGRCSRMRARSPHTTQTSEFVYMAQMAGCDLQTARQHGKTTNLRHGHPITT
jgi:hypothetical protein